MTKFNFEKLRCFLGNHSRLFTTTTNSPNFQIGWELWLLVLYDSFWVTISKSKDESELSCAYLGHWMFVLVTRWPVKGAKSRENTQIGQKASNPDKVKTLKRGATYHPDLFLMISSVLWQGQGLIGSVHDLACS